jgi:hypothetical protein
MGMSADGGGFTTSGVDTIKTTDRSPDRRTAPGLRLRRAGDTKCDRPPAGSQRAASINSNFWRAMP